MNEIHKMLKRREATAARKVWVDACTIWSNARKAFNDARRTYDDACRIYDASEEKRT